jgi:hypothetical protein
VNNVNNVNNEQREQRGFFEQRWFSTVNNTWTMNNVNNVNNVVLTWTTVISLWLTMNSFDEQRECWINVNNTWTTVNNVV